MQICNVIVEQCYANYGLFKSRLHQLLSSSGWVFGVGVFPPTWILYSCEDVGDSHFYSLQGRCLYIYTCHLVSPTSPNSSRSWVENVLKCQEQPTVKSSEGLDLPLGG